MWRLQTIIAEFDAERFESLGPGYVALSLAGEAGELANEIKKLWRSDPRIAQPEGYAALQGSDREMVANEIADVVMLSIVLANHLGIDVEAELQRKLEVIATRVDAGYYGHDARPLERERAPRAVSEHSGQ